MKHYQKLCSLFLCLLLLSQLLSVTVLATQETEPIAWELSEDEQTLTNGFDRYTRVSFYSNVSLDPKQIYRYATAVEFSEVSYLFGGESFVYAPMPDSEFVWLEGDDSIFIYATEKGQRDLQAFLELESGFYRLTNAQTETTAVLDEELLQAMEGSAGSKKSVEVTALRDQERHNILFYDSTDTLSYVYGAIYVLDDSYYYLNYLTLGNQYFDADGNFSYRSGTVELTVLNDGLCADIRETVDSQKYRSTQYEYETDIPDTDTYENPSGFWVGFVLFGIILPIPFLLIGLLVPRSEKRGYPKYWYVLAIIAAAWLLLAILFGLLVMI